MGALAQVDTGGGVAYMAHIGGFVFGMLLGRLVDPVTAGWQAWSNPRTQSSRTIRLPVQLPGPMAYGD